MARHPHVAPAGGPLVAVTASVRADDGVARVRLAVAYIEVLARAGLTPLVLPPVSGDDAAIDATIARVLDAVSGLVLTGGEDVAPAFYGAVPSPHLGRVNRARDATELAAVRAARDRRLPTLAICRGIQVMNVALGGTLVQDIPSERTGSLAHDPELPRTARSHAVQVVPGSRLAQGLGATSLDVNSVHHQAVDRVASGLVVTATAPDGVIEGIEPPPNDPWWAVAIQWHPEEFVHDEAALDHRLFAAFAAVLEGAPIATP
jgi:gamma-glutamyl-gamma-aminobutyrate hydrolase PuuD